MSAQGKPKMSSSLTALAWKCASAVFSGCVFGVLAFFVGVSLFALDLSPEQRDPAFFAAVFASGFAALAGVGGYFIGPRVFDGISGWTP